MTYAVKKYINKEIGLYVTTTKETGKVELVSKWSTIKFNLNNDDLEQNLYCVLKMIDRDGSIQNPFTLYFDKNKLDKYMIIYPNSHTENIDIMLSYQIKSNCIDNLDAGSITQSECRDFIATLYNAIKTKELREEILL